MVLLFGIFTVVFMVLPIWQEYIYARQVPVLKILTDNNIRLVVIISLLVVTVLSLIGKIFTSKKIFYWISYFSGILTFSLIASMVNVLQDYQIKRLIVFLNPYVDPQGSGWNIIQSITAIGSGAIFGKGYLQGTQSHYRYLPQQSTDFIFSILSEEWGFVGGLVVFLLYAFILSSLNEHFDITISGAPFIYRTRLFITGESTSVAIYFLSVEKVSWFTVWAFSRSEI